MLCSRLRARAQAATLVAAVSCSVSVAACGSSKGSSGTTSTAAATGSKPGSTSTGTSTSAGAGKATGNAQTTSSHAISERIVTATSGTVTATMNAAGHHPRVNVPWPIRFVVRNAGKAARAEVEYEYLFGGQVVAHRSHYRFTGTFHDTFMWPASAVGFPITFRAVIVSEGITLNLDYPVQVRR